MSSQKDMRRADLVIPYTDPTEEKEQGGDMAGTLANTLPMAAMFTRNKLIGWTSLVFSLQTYLAETPEQKKNSTGPGYLSVFMSVMALGTTYLPLLMPPASKRGNQTAAPAPTPQ